MVKEWLLILSMMLSIADGSHGVQKTCYECADESPDNYMCKFGGMASGRDPWKGICCSKDNKSIYCKKTRHNICGPSLSDSNMYWGFCPQTDARMCGTPNSEDMNLEAQSYMQTFEHNLLNIEGSWYKNKRYDACYYQISLPNFKFRPGASIMVRFTKLGSGVKIYVNGGTGIGNATQVMTGPVPNQPVAVPYQWYALPGQSGTPPQAATSVFGSLWENESAYFKQNNKIVIAIKVEKDNYDTNFGFEYYANGEQYPWYWNFIFTQTTGEHGRIKLFFLGGCSVIIVLLIFCVLVGALRNCCKKKGEVSDNKINTGKTVQGEEEKDIYLQSSHDTLGNEDNIMKLESIVPDSEVNPPHYGIEMQNQEPQIKKVGQYQRRQMEEDLKRIYQNPFKKQSI